MEYKKIKISTVRLGNDAEQVSRLIQSMEKELRNMEENVNQIVTMWEGDAKNSFVSVFQDDMVIAKELMKMLKALQISETRAKTEYEKCEYQIGEIINSIRV